MSRIDSTPHVIQWISMWQATSPVTRSCLDLSGLSPNLRSPAETVDIRGNNWCWTRQSDFEPDHPGRQVSRPTLRLTALESADGKLSRPVHDLRFPLAPPSDRGRNSDYRYWPSAQESVARASLALNSEPPCSPLPRPGRFSPTSRGRCLCARNNRHTKMPLNAFGHRYWRQMKNLSTRHPLNQSPWLLPSTPDWPGS